ncbi:MAG TPA: hypothetical protein VGM41_02010, partial [Chitinophagaceae bacterium]
MKALPLIRFLRKPDNQPLAALLLHWMLLALLCTSAIVLFGNRLPALTNLHLRHWDAEWYYLIKKRGYDYIAGRQGTMAFFPLFPFLWKFSFLNEEGISLFNALIFSASFWWLARTLKLGFVSSLLFLSTPSLLFCFIPYSEALFFMSSTILLIGLHKKNDPLIIAGMCLAAFSRSVNIVLIPALLYTYVLNYGLSAKTIRFVLAATLCVTAATMVVFWIQYLSTGQWYVFFDMQKQWHRSLQLPTLPLTTLSTKVLWLDVIALFVAVLAAGDTVMEAIRVLLRREKAGYSAMAQFSMVYIALMGFLAVFYSGIWPGQHSSSIMSLNRFVFAGPYFICYCYERSAKSKTILSGLLFLSALSVALCSAGIYEKLSFLGSYPVTLCYFAAIGLYITLYYFAFHRRELKLFFYSIHVITMILLLFDFLGYG